MISHPLSEYKNLRKIFHQRVQAKEVVIRNNRVQSNPLLIHQNPRGHVNVISHAHQDDHFPSTIQFEDAQESSMVSSSIANSLMMTLKFLNFFYYIGFIEEIQIVGE